MSRRGDPYASEIGFLVAFFFCCVGGAFLGGLLAFWVSPCAC